MPPTFLYLAATLIWSACACAVWITAIVLLVTSRTRLLSKPLSLAMAGTFPFVFAYQLAAAPIVAVVLLSTWALCKWIEPGSSSLTTNPVVILSSIAAAFIALATILLMSLAGFYDGWRTGWKYGRGESLRVALSGAAAYKAFRLCGRVLHSRRSSVTS